MFQLWRRGAVGAALILSAVLGAAPAIAAADPPPAIITSYAGKTTAQWSENWWQWAAAFPATTSPVTDTTGASCGLRQNQPVFFLAGTTGTTETRDCQVPADKAVLVPAINAECSSVPGDCGSPARSYERLSAAAAAQFSGGVTTSVVLDGMSLPVEHVISPPPPFSITFAADNPFGLPGGTGVSVANGYYVLLAPLPLGHHTLTLHGALNGTSYSITVNYSLLVTQK